MPNESDAGHPAPLPAELIPDFDRFRSDLERRATASGPCAPLSRPEAVAAWREYGRLLHERSAGLALIAKGDRGEVFTRHIEDSLNPLALFDAPPRSILDIGSGGGLPGIPLGIAWPGTRVVLLESRERKAGFLEQAVRSLGLRNARVACARLEDGEGAWLGEPVEAVFIRAVGDLPSVLRLAARLSCPGARWVYFIGSRSEQDALPDDAAFEARVVEGVFGGRLLTGLFCKMR